MTTLKMRMIYAVALYHDNGATLDDVREAVTTLEDLARITRRVLGCTHPTVGRLGFAKCRKRRAREWALPAAAAAGGEAFVSPPAVSTRHFGPK